LASTSSDEKEPEKPLETLSRRSAPALGAGAHARARRRCRPPISRRWNKSSHAH